VVVRIQTAVAELCRGLCRGHVLNITVLNYAELS
jgi:hypothetical protein